MTSTFLQPALKSEYGKKESQLILQKLSDHQQKVPIPDRNDVMKMLNESIETVKFRSFKLGRLLGDGA